MSLYPVDFMSGPFCAFSCWEIFVFASIAPTHRLQIHKPKKSVKNIESVLYNQLSRKSCAGVITVGESVQINFWLK